MENAVVRGIEWVLPPEIMFAAKVFTFYIFLKIAGYAVALGLQIKAWFEYKAKAEEIKRSGDELIAMLKNSKVVHVDQPTDNNKVN